MTARARAAFAAAVLGLTACAGAPPPPAAGIALRFADRGCTGPTTYDTSRVILDLTEAPGAPVEVGSPNGVIYVEAKIDAPAPITRVRFALGPGPGTPLFGAPATIAATALPETYRAERRSSYEISVVPAPGGASPQEIVGVYATTGGPTAIAPQPGIAPGELVVTVEAAQGGPWVYRDIYLFQGDELRCGQRSSLRS